MESVLSLLYKLICLIFFIFFNTNGIVLLHVVPYLTFGWFWTNVFNAINDSTT